MARTYQGFLELRNAVDEFPPAGRIYTKPKIDKKSIMDAEYVVVPSREVDGYTDEKGGRIPSLLAGQGYSSWLEAPRGGPRRHGAGSWLRRRGRSRRGLLC